MKRQLVYLLLLLTRVSFGQDAGFGDITTLDFQASAGGADSSAAAIILFDIGTTDFDLSPEGGGFHYTLERHQRIRILNEKGYEWANIEIPLYREGAGEEKLLEFSACTYNLEDGKIIPTMLVKKAGFSEKFDKNFMIHKFPLPNVKEGSIIEVKYKIRSDFIFKLRDWYFQYTIPALRSEYKISIPEYMLYSINLLQFHPVKQIEHRREPRHFLGSISYNTVNTQRARYDFSCNMIVNKWRSEKVPAFKVEPYIGTPDDYIAKVEMELASTDFPGDIKRHYDSWDETMGLLAEDENFGKFLNEESYASEIVNGIINPGDSVRGKLLKIYDFVRNNVKWNGERSKFSSKTSVKNVLDQKSGNTADVNLTLVNLLRKAGLKAYPVLLSTRSNGLHSGYMQLSKFNSVIAAIKQPDTSDNYLLLDATDVNYKPGLIEIESLNHIGLVVDIPLRKARWISLEPQNISRSIISYVLSMDENLQFEGKIYSLKSEYTGWQAREHYKSFTSQGEYQNTYSKNKNGLQINAYSASNTDNPVKPFNESFDIAINGFPSITDSLVYFNPLFFEQVKENPFKTNERNFPVDFPYPWEENYRLILSIPENYTIETLPKGEMFTLPNKSGSFYYTVFNEQNQLRIESRIKIANSLYLPEEYPGLQELFKHVVSKHAEMIVLRK